MYENLTESPGTKPATKSRRPRQLIAAAATALLLLGVTSTSEAATRVSVTNPGGLNAVGPVNSEYGFPSWYGDSAGTRVEPCIDGDNPLCGFLPGDIPNPDAPLAFPDNWPGELFYQLVASSLTLPGGGKANLTLGLEASFANGDPIAGDQVTFARTRVTVVGGPRSTTMTFKHPFGELTVDTDATGRGRLVQDITPAVGNFATALSGNFGPFLRWDPAVAPAAPAGYLGDPAQQHSVVGGKNGYNEFSTVIGSTTISNDQFGVSGKIATNTGVTGDRAVINNGFVDVFATSSGDQLQVDGVNNQYATTPMTNDVGSNRHYARIALLNSTKPTSITVRNLGDKPASTVVVKLADVTVTEASYDGAQLTVAAESDNFPLTVTGFGSLPDNHRVSFTAAAPPASVTIRSANGAPVSYPVTISGGSATDPGLPPVPAEPAGPPVYDNTPDNPGGPAPTVSVLDPAATLPGASVTLDASATTLATSYTWTLESGPAGATLTNATTSKPTVALPYFITNAATAPVADWPPVVVKLVAANANGTTEKQVSVPVKKDVVTIAAGARHRIRTELRVDGTSLVDGQAGARTPATVVTVWDMTRPATPVKLGTAPVDTLGAWSLRLKPGPAVQVTSVLVQSTRGSTATSAVAR